jgi:2-keto-4-pentenoate hydratase/2-oxohepta-3-ene-1,7-dioic acid hydratase in catechol pathway
MRLFTVETPGKTLIPAVQVNKHSLITLWTLLGRHAPATLAEALVRNREIQDAVADLDDAAVERLAHWLVPLDSALLGPACDPGALLVLAGSNYRSHVAEMDKGGKVSSKATTFVKSTSAVVGSGRDIVIPRQFPDKVDFEGEICIVFGRHCHDVTEADAMSYVGGYTILNDVSARDAVPAMLFATTPAEATGAMMDMMMGKHLPTFAPVGPAVVTPDEIADVADMRLVTRVNGEVMQDANTADLVLGFAELIAQMSKNYLFRPGDILSTGTPSGVGFSRKPPVFLKPGDVVTIEVTGVGTLENHVSASGK